MDQIDDFSQNSTFTHFSHHHPLQHKVACETDDATCSGCKNLIPVDEVYYTCNSCSYSLHRTRYELPVVFQHISEPGHDLNLLELQSFECTACGLHGSDFCYHCRTCAANYHALCVRMPLSASCASHHHELKIQFAPPYGGDMGFLCDVCKNPSSSLWLYRCSECDFDAHLHCVFPVLIPQSRSQNIPKMVNRGPVRSAIAKTFDSILFSVSGPVHSVDAAFGGPIEICSSSGNHEAKLQPQSSSDSLFRDSPFSRDSRSRLLDTLDQSLCRVQRTARISTEKSSGQCGDINYVSSLEDSGN